MAESRKDKKEEHAFKGKVDTIPFPGQHSQWGGFSSCVFNAANAADFFINLKPEDFFKQFAPGLSEHEKKEASKTLGKLVENSNEMNLNYAKLNTNRFAALFYRLVPKELSGMLDILTSAKAKGFESIQDLKIMAEEDACHKDHLLDFCEKIYSQFGPSGLEKNDFTFLSAAAFHEIAFFAKTRPSDGQTFFFIYDTAPSRVFGGDKNTGTLEIHDNIESAIKSVTDRWKVAYKNDTEGTIYAVTSHSRIKALQQEVKPLAKSTPKEEASPSTTPDPPKPGPS